MLNLFRLFKPKGKEKKSGEDAKKKSDARWATSRSAGSTSDKTLLVNDTDKKLVLRDKLGATYGGTRYVIPGKSEMEVTTLQHTFFKMIAYAIEEDAEQGQSSANDAQQKSEPKKTPKSIDTKLTIDSDRLADCKKIVISFERSHYKLDFINR